MEKQKMETTGVVEGNIDKVRALFPHCITEIKGADGKLRYAVDFDKLRVELGDDTVEGQRERYQFTWPQKSVASALANTPTRMTLRPDRDSSVDFDNTENLYIEGDNLEVLKVLRETYLGQVKMIYIDPPYNTGKDFVYKDRRYLSQQEMDEKEGKFDEYGNLLFTNSDSNGRFHTDWLNFIYPRLKVARDLLTDDGVIFISIDDNEIDNLKKICNEIFGNENFIGQITVVANPRGRDYGGIARMHDYILAFSKSDLTSLNLIKDENSTFPMEDELGGFELRELRNRNIKFNKENRPNLYYPFYVNTSIVDSNGLCPISLERSAGFDYELYPLESQGINTVWRWGKQKSLSNLNINIAAKPMRNGSYMIVEKYREPRRMARSVWWDKESNTERGTLLVKDLFNAKVFDYPKPVELIERLLEMGTNEDSIILDFFSGSSTTAHAVMKLNAEDESVSRKFIMVQLAELTPEDSEARKNGYTTICEIAKERIRRAGKKIKEEAGEKGKDLDIGFRVLKLDTSNMKDVFYNPAAVSQLTLDDMIDNVKEGRSDEDLLFQVMLQNNIPVSAKIEKISVNGHPAYVVDEGALIATFDRTLDDATLVELAKMEPMKFVMREPEERDGVNPDNLIDNFEQKFELYSPNTQRSIL